MEFDVKKNTNPNLSKFAKEDADIAFKFAKKAYKEFGAFLKCVVLFGSVPNNRATPKSDIDILLVIDDVALQLTPAVVESYRIIVEKMVRDTSDKLHITTLKLTNFWEYIRSGDPIGLNMLRDGVALIDTGFFEPLRVLLAQGRFRPSIESVHAYAGRSKMTLHNSRWHLSQATVDLYWAVIDAAHAAIMKQGKIPPTPNEVGEILKREVLDPGHIDKKYAKTMDKFYKISKQIIHKEKTEVSGEEYEQYYKEASDFVNALKAFVERK